MYTNPQTGTYNENAMFDELIDKVIDHDYSYMMSDDNRSYSSGASSENKIKNLINKLITEYNYNPEGLKQDCLNNRSEQYRDGLTHRVIHSWFNQYNDRNS